MTSEAREILALQMYAEFAHRADDGRLAEWAKLFAEDAVMTIRGEQYDGRNAIHGWITQSLTEGVPSSSRHVVTNVRVHVDGDAAQMRSLFSVVRPVDGAVVTVALGEYRTRMRWDSDEWKLVRHDVTFVLDPRRAD